MAILVTGGAGFIGSHTCVELINSGYEIIVVDNFSNSNPESLNRINIITEKKLKIYNVDLLQIDRLEQVFKENDIQGVIHFAGLKAVGESVKNPFKYYQNNITGTLILLETMRKHEVFKIVFSSSATVYGLPEYVPISENSMLNPTNPYGRTKQMIEEILSDIYISENRWSIAVLRYFNPIGAHASGLIGEDPKGVPNNLMPYITQVASGKLKDLNIFGDNYNTVDGTGVRDYIHVTDLAKGHIKALDKVFELSGFNVYNLGTGNGYSVLQIIKAFEKVTGTKIPYTIGSRRSGDIGECFADPTKAEEELGWKAEKNIEEMCLDSWRWQSNNPEGYSKVLLSK
ncbi:UDP-glucose 4-epimerase GalE [Bacillus sp. F19]|nr:UDP-glucose 4-epimerase GalE [Bacillus sp. F19]